MNEPTEARGDYIVHHYEMGAVDGMHMYREIPFYSEVPEKNADNKQNAVGEHKRHAETKDAMTANWVRSAREAVENERKGRVARHQPRWDDRGTVLANNSIDFLEVKEMGQCAADLPRCGRVYLTRENDAKRRRLDTENASGLSRTTAPVNQHLQQASPYPRCMPCVMIQLFVIVFLLAASGLGLVIFFMTGHSFDSMRCDSSAGNTASPAPPKLPMYIQDMKTQISQLKKELNLTRQELQQLKEAVNNTTNHLPDDSKIKHSEDIATLWTSLNSTRQMLTDLHQTRNSSDAKQQQLWTTFSAERNTTQQKLNSMWRTLNSSLKHIQHSNDTAARQLNATLHTLFTDMQNTRNFIDAQLQDQRMTLWSTANYTRQELQRMARLVNSSLTQMLNVTKMSAHQGYNASQGLSGAPGPMGPAGPMGIANFSRCQYSVGDSGGVTPGQDVDIFVLAADTLNTKIIAATCSTNFAADYIFTGEVYGNIPHYKCRCKGASSIFVPTASETTNCYIHYWECPLTT